MKLLITAGPTREPIDPVRFISNRSSGKMGYALAFAGVERGHEVVLISGPVSIGSPGGVQVESVITAKQMLDAVLRHVDECDALIMAAAVCDWSPATTSDQKIKKLDGLSTLALVRTADILQSIESRKAHRVFVGFAAETQDLMNEAKRKLHSKGLDLIVANDVSRSDIGFEVDANEVVLLERSGTVTLLPLMSKHDVAHRLIEWVENRVNQRACPA